MEDNDDSDLISAFEYDSIRNILNSLSVDIMDLKLNIGNLNTNINHLDREVSQLKANLNGAANAINSAERMIQVNASNIDELSKKLDDIDPLVRNLNFIVEGEVTRALKKHGVGKKGKYSKARNEGGLSEGGSRNGQ